MVADHGGVAVPVPIQDVAGNLKLTPPDHAWVQSARRVGTCFGD
jgi:6-phosphofructokinase 1